ncbi:MAG: heterodisulfide reductase, subunit B, partial [Thermoproteota archaeon]
AGFAHDILSAARRRGAELVVTSCPLCFFNLDRRQEEVSRIYEGYEPIPVLYVTQLLALALGIRDVYMFNLHHVDPASLLKSKGLL